MSYYYNYYLGYKKENKFYPLGPYDANGKLHEVICKSRSFASDLHEDFWHLKDEEMSEELKKAFSYETGSGEIQYQKVKYLPFKLLPSDNFVKSGYYLIKDIDEYIKSNGDTEDLFYEKLDSTVYAMKLKNEIALGKESTKYDCEGEELENYSASDYAFFAYPDYNSKEFEAFIIRQAANMFEFSELLKDAEIVVLETEG